MRIGDLRRTRTRRIVVLALAVVVTGVAAIGAASPPAHSPGRAPLADPGEPVTWTSEGPG